jgi:hypothetical protein
VKLATFRIFSYTFLFSSSRNIFLLNNFYNKDEVIYVRGCGGPYSCETSRIPHFLDNRLTVGGEVVSLTLQSIPVASSGGPQGCETSRLPIF